MQKLFMAEGKTAPQSYSGTVLQAVFLWRLPFLTYVLTMIKPLYKGRLRHYWCTISAERGAAVSLLPVTLPNPFSGLIFPSLQTI